MTTLDRSDKTVISFTALFLLIAVVLVFMACDKWNGAKDSSVKASIQPVSVPYFKQGQILYPDYVCPDTLVVFDAEGLNKGMALVEQGFLDASDYQIDSILHENCNILP